ncbi:hypothetical protein LBMAG49_05130 [Planctomycetota bacterium]|nr:hypothetical protein LBMAG49_05130 [Planctomycetota bacterium]
MDGDLGAEGQRPHSFNEDAVFQVGSSDSNRLIHECEGLTIAASEEGRRSICETVTPCSPASTGAVQKQLVSSR